MRVLIYLFFIVATVATTIFLYSQKLQQDKNHTDSLYIEVETNYKAFLRQYENVSQIIYDELMHDKKAISLLEKMQTASGEEFELLRSEFIEHISYLKRQVDLMHFSQIHFHDSKIRSLYRSSAPNRYGDSLEEFRKSVVYVNKHKERTYGLEEGRVVNGFRFVYPIFSGEKFIGSVGFSVGTKVMQNEMAELFNGNFWIVLDRELIENITFEKSFSKNYKSTALSEELIVESDINDKSMFEDFMSELSSKEIDKKLDRERLYTTLVLDGVDYTVMFLPLKNISGEHMGYLVYAGKDRYLKFFEKEFYIASFGFTLLWLFVLLSALKILKTQSRLMLENSKRKEAEEKLKNLNTNLESRVEEEIEKRAQKESLLSSLFENAPLGIVLSDMNRVVLDANRAFLHMTGYEKEELVDRSITEISTDEDTELLLKFQKELVESKRDVYCMEKGYIKKDGSTMRANVFVSYIKGRDDFLLGIIEDITAKKEIEKKQRDQEQMLVQQSKMAMMGEMMGAIAHQWRQPLNSLSMLVQNLEDAYEYGSFSEEMLKDSVQKSVYQIEYMSKTIDDFRNFYRPDKHKKKFDIKSAIENVIKLINAQFSHHSIVIKQEYQEGFDFYAYGVESEFRQVVLNILSNAKDSIIASKQEDELGEVHVNVLKDGDKNVIEICDSGHGIREDIKSRIFEPYFTTKLDSKGTGVGLYMSKIIIENNMEGRLFLKDGDCKGATFVIVV